jgi:cytochrome c
MEKAVGFILAATLLWQDNHPPVVKIVTPDSNTPLNATEQIHYAISVADKEDGDSKYEEINSKEVLLEVRYVKTGAAIQTILKKGVKDDPPGLTMIRTNNCFNCHNFDGKGIGPSFYDISKRYPFTPANISQVARRVREGSSGVWGKVSMPTHPELKQEEAEAVVRWILQNGAKPDVSYYVGVEGNFKVSQGLKGAYILTASYVDHGKKEGQDRVVVRVSAIPCAGKKRFEM